MNLNKKLLCFGLLLLSLLAFMRVSKTLAATLNVDMGDMAPPCGGVSGPADIGFVDCNTTGTGGVLITAVTDAVAGDTVQWAMRSTPHTASSEAALTGGPNVACGTGDRFDSAVGNAFSPGFVFKHTFKTPGSCTYYCIVHPKTMQGQVNVSRGRTATLTPTTTAIITTATTPAGDEHQEIKGQAGGRYLMIGIVIGGLGSAFLFFVLRHWLKG